jgi:ribonuclease BN (tRNA processing enzyme)
MPLLPRGPLNASSSRPQPSRRRVIAAAAGSALGTGRMLTSLLGRSLKPDPNRPGRLPGRSVVSSGDVEGTHGGLVELARGCDMLVHDLALPEREVEHGELHATPSAVGKLAAPPAVGCWWPPNVMPELEDELDQAVAEVRRHYQSELLVAEELVTVALDDDGSALVTPGRRPRLVELIRLFLPGVFGLSGCLRS